MIVTKKLLSKGNALSHNLNLMAKAITLECSGKHILPSPAPGYLKSLTSSVSLLNEDRPVASVNY